MVFKLFHKLLMDLPPQLHIRNSFFTLRKSPPSRGLLYFSQIQVNPPCTLHFIFTLDWVYFSEEFKFEEIFSCRVHLIAKSLHYNLIFLYCHTFTVCMSACWRVRPIRPFDINSYTIEVLSPLEGRRDNQSILSDLCYLKQLVLLASDLVN